MDLTRTVPPVGIPPRSGDAFSEVSTPSSAMSGSTGGRVMDCSIESHKTQKVTIKDDTLYLQGLHGGQALLEPSLSMLQLPTEVSMEDLVVMEKPFQVMSALFERITAEVKEEKSKFGTASNFSTPGPWVPNARDIK
eukprot:scaffold5333_cov49-Attheya_sp.AAC.1